MPLVETDLSGRVMTITLADEERRNSLSRQLTGELVAALDIADHDPAVRVVILTNKGTVFCAGANLADQSSADTTAVPGRDLDPRALFGRFRHSPKPYVGRIAGHCVAGGMGLAAALDISVAVDHATFGFTEVRIGVAPAMISVVCLPKMRPADARAAFLRGHRFRAAEAVRMGLINSAVPAAKQLMVVVPGLPEDEAFEWTAALSARLFAGDEAREGITAYLEKRPASWIP
jgi:enoyl-CoA hydratase/carnithine racemase